jgi:hypothetical protein
MKPTIEERGWIAWFICAERCRFRRNTLITLGRRRVVVGTIGLFFAKPGDKEPNEVGYKRFYETQAFHAHLKGVYWEANISRPIQFAALGQQANWKSRDADLLADEMHNAVVREIVTKLEEGKHL